jgi:hypothetical protein
VDQLRGSRSDGLAVLTDLPRPGAVIGDQLPTDGLLTYRPGYTYLHYAPHLASVPAGPKLMHSWRQLVRPLLFRCRACPPHARSPGPARSARSTDHVPADSNDPWCQSTAVRADGKVLKRSAINQRGGLLQKLLIGS